MIELSLGTAMRQTCSTSPSDRRQRRAGASSFFRVREVGWSGLSVALAASFLMVTCSVGKERDVDKDVSYFRTSSPGDSTISIVSLAPDAMRALLFFPEASEVTGDVRTYFDDLASVTKKDDKYKLRSSTHDRYLDSTLATKYKVRADDKLGMVGARARRAATRRSSRRSISSSIPTSSARRTASCATSTARSTRRC